MMLQSRLMDLSEEEAIRLYEDAITRFVNSERSVLDYLELLDKHEKIGRLLPQNIIKNIIEKILEEYPNKTRIGAIKELKFIKEIAGVGPSQSAMWRRAITFALNIAIEILKGKTASDILNDDNNKQILKG